MTNKVISFRISPENYLKVEMLAAEKGLSVSRYLKQKTERELEDLAGDVRLMQSDIKDILEILSQNKSEPNQINQDKFTSNVLLEMLMILRETTPPAKLANAQKALISQGYSLYNTLGDGDE